MKALGIDTLDTLRARPRHDGRASAFRRDVEAPLVRMVLLAGSFIAAFGPVPAMAQERAASSDPASTEIGPPVLDEAEAKVAGPVHKDDRENDAWIRRGIAGTVVAVPTIAAGVLAAFIFPMGLGHGMAGVSAVRSTRGKALAGSDPVPWRAASAGRKTTESLVRPIPCQRRKYKNPSPPLPPLTDAAREVLPHPVEGIASGPPIPAIPGAQPPSISRARSRIRVGEIGLVI
mgnify:CR=1 FL=1